MERKAKRLLLAAYKKIKINGSSQRNKMKKERKGQRGEENGCCGAACLFATVVALIFYDKVGSDLEALMEDVLNLRINDYSSKSGQNSNIITNVVPNYGNSDPNTMLLSSDGNNRSCEKKDILGMQEPSYYTPPRYFSPCYVLSLPPLSTKELEYFFFVQQWPKSYCYFNRDDCVKKKLVEIFSIHGIWPANSMGASLRECADPKPNEKSFVKPIEYDLKTYWPRFSRKFTNEKFWEHEQNKHGICSTRLNPSLYGGDYFRGALQMKRAIDIYGILRDIGGCDSALEMVIPEKSSEYKKLTSGHPLKSNSFLSLTANVTISYTTPTLTWERFQVRVSPK
ncbi:hypothetical protein LguiA_012287 [Lonicera macranthoides]